YRAIAGRTERLPFQQVWSALRIHPHISGEQPRPTAAEITRVWFGGPRGSDPRRWARRRAGTGRHGTSPRAPPPAGRALPSAGTAVRSSTVRFGAAPGTADARAPTCMSHLVRCVELLSDI